MCLDFLLFWPAQRRNATDGSLFMCGFTATQKNGNITACGFQFESEWPNPSLNDTHGTPDIFGKSVDTCAAAPNASNEPDAVVESNEANGSNENTCFPASAIVELCGFQGARKMEDIQVGDKVAVGNGKCSEVFMFTHRMHNEYYEFVVLQTENGEEVELTESHYIYVNNELRTAKTVRVGDFLEDRDGRYKRVTEVSRRVNRGLYNPQTMHGDIVVNGVKTSTFTKVVAPRAAHALLTPLRIFKKYFGFSTDLFENGASMWACVARNAQKIMFP